ncbi:MAG TPA: hypothetical protein VJ984_07090 [Xanthomonadales bacterium]|nr:hypothetical protein [Xanthomonadales bacterium]
MNSVFIATFGLVLLLMVSPALLAQDGSDGNEPQTSSPFSIKSKSTFGCAEVDEVKSGALASHEITVDPRRVERCLREKVGTRFHECKKLKIVEATADWNGIVTIDTEGGPVKFWFEDHDTGGSGEAKRVMVWSWPDTEKLYMCAAITSKR